MAPRRLVPVLVLFALLVTVLASVPAFAQEITPAPDATLEATLEATPEATPEATQAPEETPEATATPEASFDSYVVQWNDTLARIARRFNLPIETLMADNAITNANLIFLGQTLRIRTAGQPVPPTATPVPPPTAVPGPTTSYVVQRGDTLARIASRFGTTVESLLALNSLTDPNLIFAGQTIQVSGQAQPPAATPEPEQPTPEPTVDVEATAIPVADAQFGYGIEAFMTAQNAPEVAAAVRELGMTWVKFNLDWRDFEPAQGQIDFASLDAIVNMLDAAGLNIMLTVASAPEWARSSTEESGPPDDFATYAAFVGALAGRYAGRVDAYEIWSEPNLRREWNSTLHQISASSYFELLSGAYAAIKAADPAAVVVSAGLAPTGFNDGINAINDRLYLSALYGLGLADSSDAIGAHPNGWANPPDALCCDPAVGVETHFEDPSFYFMETLDAYRAIMAGAGDAATAVWVTDFGWGTSEDADEPSPIYVFVAYTSLAEQAIYVPRAYEIGQALGYVGPMFLKNLNGCLIDPPIAEQCFYSLIGPNGQPRPAFNAVQAIQEGRVEMGEATETPLLPEPVATEAVLPEPAATEALPLIVVTEEALG